MTTTETPITINRDDFRTAVRRNIRSLLAMTDADQQDLAPLVGLTTSKLSERLTGKAGWRDEELFNVARAFDVRYGAVVAPTVDDFHEALDGRPPVIHGLSGSVEQLDFDLAA